MANSITYNYKILNQYSAPLKKIAASTSRMGIVAAKAAASFKKMGSTFKTATNKMKLAAQRVGNGVKKMGAKFKSSVDKMGAMQGALGALGGAAAVTGIVKSTLKIQDAIADVGKVSDLTKGQLAGLRKDLEGLSERIGRPADALARIAFEGKKLGTTDKDLMPFVETVAKMAVAFDMTEESAGAAVGSIKAKLGMTMAEVVKFGDSVNHLANTTAAGGQNMINIIARTSGTMSSLRVPPDIIAGFAAIGDQLSVSAELGASGINQMFSRMSKMPGMSERLLEDPIKAVQDVMGKFAKMPEAKRMGAIYKAFGEEAGKFVLKLVPKMDLFGETMKKAMSTKAIGSMQREMDSYMGRASTRFKMAKEKMTNAMNRFGEALVPIIEIIANVAGKIGVMVGKFSEAHPKLSKIIAGGMLLTVVLTGVMAAAVILIPVFTALYGIITAITWPIMGIVAAISAVVAAIVYWIKTNNPLIQRLKHIGALVMGLVNKFTGLFGITVDGSTTLKALGIVFSFIGRVLSWLLKPIEIFLTFLTTIVNVAEKLLNLDFKGAFSELKAGGSAVGAIITGADLEKTIEANVSTESASVAASQGAASSAIAAKTQNVNVGGDILVSAAKGSKVESVTPNLDSGVNMRMAQ